MNEKVPVTIPTELLRRVRAHTRKGQFSAFVTRALRHELVRRNRQSLLDDYTQAIGPINATKVRQFRKLLKR